MNLSTTIFRNGKLKFEPSGEYEFGILDPSQGCFHMNPPWPIPFKIIITFLEDAGATQELILKTHLPSKFRGRLTVVITKTNRIYNAILDAEEKESR